MDKVTPYVINLEKDTKRLCKINSQFDALGLKRPTVIKAIMGKDIKSGEMPGIVSSFFSMFGSRGAVGCALSHVKAWETFVSDSERSEAMSGASSSEATNGEYGLFLEDDALLSKDFVEQMKLKMAHLPEDVYIFFLGCTMMCNPDKNYDFLYPLIKVLIMWGMNYYPKKLEIINEHIYVPQFPLALHGYVLSKKGARYLLDKIRQDKIHSHIDTQVLKYIQSVPSYASNPELISQEEIDINTSHNITGSFPSVINDRLTIKDSKGLPFNYKLTIGLYEYDGYSINGYFLLLILAAIALGMSKFTAKTVILSYMVFNIIELLYMKAYRRYSMKKFRTMFVMNTIIFMFFFTVTRLVYLRFMKK